MDSKFTRLFNKLLLVVLFCITATAQQTHIYLNQGVLVGLKVFPDSTRSAVYAFLGVPYAEPPVDELRFAPPKIHRGWNRTLLAMSMKPVCPQLSNTIYDEISGELVARPTETNEDCLYLNIWVSENSLRYGNQPVLVVITGEDMSYDWPRNRITGLDIAADGFVVITVQYRTNIFGWLNIPRSADLSGNYGLLDQSLALKWIQQNIKSLGGNPNQITLLGHGTSGAPCALYHAILNSAALPTSSSTFNQLILMSGGNIKKAFQPVFQTQEASNVIIKKLGCQFEEYNKQLESCLRSKSISDLLKAFESVYDQGNSSFRLGPTLPLLSFKELMANSSSVKNFPVTIMGITSNEGAFMQDYWLELTRESYGALKSYINNTLLRNVFAQQKQHVNGSNKRSLEALNWRYFSHDFEANPIQLLADLQRFISEYYYEIPFYELLKDLTNALETGLDNKKIYAYINDFSNAMDIRGKINMFEGASHSSDLPFLFGPSLFQQIARRRLNKDEEILYQKIRKPFLNFIKTGNPATGDSYNLWTAYSSKNKFIYELGETLSNFKTETNFVDPKRLHKITQFLYKNEIMTVHSRPHRTELSNSYQMQDIQNRQSDSTKNMQTSFYNAHLMRVYRFWQVFLPETLPRQPVLISDNSQITQHLLYMEATADAARFKHGFFAMLGLVLLLLALLCLCVYLLRRDDFPSPTPFNCDL